MDSKPIILSDRYELIEILGSGGMSEVWKARHIHLDKIVAIKLLRRFMPGREDCLARFRQEARIAGGLVHENICAVTDFGFTSEDVPYIVMEYLEGETLRQVLRRMTRLPVDAAFAVMRSILRGLEAAHAMGIVHRDIKPGNIFIALGKDGRRTVKILDFGISKVLFGGTSSLVETVTGEFLGTAYYLSPEQITDSKSVDARADVYAAGAVLYKMLTGSVPFGGRNVGEVSVKIARSALVDPRKHVSSLGGSVVKIVHKAMEKSVEARYRSAAEMLGDIEALGIGSSDAVLDTLSGERSIGAAPGTAGGIPSRRRGTAAALLVLAFAAALALIFSPQLCRWMGRKGGVSGPAGLGASKEPAADAGEEETAGHETPVPSRTVKIRFTSLPAGAKVRIGAKVFSGDSIEIEKSSAAVVVALHADGYVTKNIHVIPDADLEIDGSLAPLAGRDAGSAGEETPAAATKPGKHVPKRPSGPEPPKGEEKKGDKLQFIRTLSGSDGE